MSVEAIAALAFFFYLVSLIMLVLAYRANFNAKAREREAEALYAEARELNALCKSNHAELEQYRRLAQAARAQLNDEALRN